jgi:serine/threonine kinase 16
LSTSPFLKVHRKKPFSELKALQIIHQIMSGVSAMHEANYSHRDIKLENILIDSTGKPVLMDFGSVGPLEERIATRQQVLTLVETASPTHDPPVSTTRTPGWWS